MDRPSAPLNPQLLHRHAPGLRALVRTLVLDDSRVDDIVQETWLAALKRPPQQEEKTGAWLAVVARRIVQRGRREHARRAQREERAAQPESMPSTDEIVAREMARRELVDVVLELDEPYRTAILLRYFEGLAPQEIATRLAAPLETVRTRLKRGLERLREKLDRKNGGDSKAWHLALLPLAQLPLGPFAPLAPTAAGEALNASASSSASTTVVIGSIVTAAAAVLAGVWAIFGGNVGGTNDGEGSTSLARIEIDSEPAPRDPELRRTGDNESTARFSTLRLLERTSGAPRGAIALASAEVPWAGSSRAGWQRKAFDRANVRMEEEAQWFPLGESDASGSLAVPIDEAQRFPIVLDPHWSFALPPDALGRQTEFVVERAGVLRGRVLADGPLAAQALQSGSAIVRLVPTGTRDGHVRIGFWDAIRGARGVRVRSTGEFEFNGLPLELVYRVEAFVPEAGAEASLAIAHHVELESRPDSERQLNLKWTDEGARVSGYVSGVEGFPIANARVALFHIGSVSEEWEYRRGESSFGPIEPSPIARLRGDDAGVFAFEHLPDGRYRIEAEADGFEFTVRHFEIQDGATAPLSLRLELGSTLEGQVRDEVGAPIADAFLVARHRGGDQFTRSDANGTFRFQYLRAGAWSLQVWSEGFVGAERSIDVLRGDSGWLDLELRRATSQVVPLSVPRVDLHARVIERGTDRGLVGALIEVDQWRERGSARPESKGLPLPPRAVLTDAQGAFRVPNIAAGRVSLRVSCVGYGEITMDLQLGSNDVHQVIALERAASLSGVLSDRSGQALAGRQIYARGSGARVVETDAAGRYTFVDLTPGKWSLGVPSASSALEADRGGEGLREVELEPGAAVQLDLVVDLLPTGRSTLLISSALEQSCALILRGADQALQRIARPGRVHQGEPARFEALPSGRYRLQARGSDGVMRLYEVLVQDDEEVLQIPAAEEHLFALEARDETGRSLEIVELGDAPNAAAARGTPREGPAGRRGRKGHSPTPISAIATNGGAWQLEVLARDAEGQRFQGALRIESPETESLEAATISIVLQPVAPLEPHGAAERLDGR